MQMVEDGHLRATGYVANPAEDFHPQAFPLLQDEDHSTFCCSSAAGINRVRCSAAEDFERVCCGDNASQGLNATHQEDCV